MLKITRSWDRLIFNMGIPTLVRRHIYIETVPWPPSQYKDGLFTEVRIPITKIRLSWNSLIFIMGMPFLVRRRLYIETTGLRLYEQWQSGNHHDQENCQIATQTCTKWNLHWSTIHNIISGQVSIAEMRIWTHQRQSYIFLIGELWSVFREFLENMIVLHWNENDFIFLMKYSTLAAPEVVTFRPVTTFFMKMIAFPFECTYKEVWL